MSGEFKPTLDDLLRDAHTANSEAINLIELTLMAATEISDEEDRWALQAGLMAAKAKAREVERLTEQFGRTDLTYPEL